MFKRSFTRSHHRTTNKVRKQVFLAPDDIDFIRGYADAKSISFAEALREIIQKVKK